MRKNSTAVFIVYVCMFAILFCVIFLLVRPIIANSNSTGPLIGFSCLFLVIGLLLNALILELGHLLGAKSGKYEVVGFNVLGFCISKNENGKWSVSFSSYEGLTGETKLLPKDVEKSTTGGLVFFPLFFFFIEVIVSVIGIAVFDNDYAQIFFYFCLMLGGMVYLYDYFPARLDAITDGYRMIALNKSVNKLAYNRLLVNQRNIDLGKSVTDTTVYDEVTDLTAQTNYLQVYNRIQNNDIGEALRILQMTLDSQNRISSYVKNQAQIMKLSLYLLTNKKDVGTIYYDDEISNNLRNRISDLDDAPSLRAYLLISGIIEGTESETNYALQKAPKILRKTEKSLQTAEEKLLKLTIQRITTLHPSWKLVMGTDLKLIKEKDGVGGKKDSNQPEQ